MTVRLVALLKRLVQCLLVLSLVFTFIEGVLFRIQ